MFTMSLLWVAAAHYATLAALLALACVLGALRGRPRP